MLEMQYWRQVLQEAEPVKLVSVKVIVLGIYWSIFAYFFDFENSLRKSVAGPAHWRLEE